MTRRDEVDQPAAQLHDNRIYIGDRFSLSLQRTLRIPDDGRTYPLPPGLGRFAVQAVSDFADRVPAAWQGTNAFFVAAYQREAVWISFDAAPWKPNAVKIGIGRVNAVAGVRWTAELQAQLQDYVVCPPQLWLDGINAGHGYVRQFVATALGDGRTVEAQLTGVESEGGIQVLVYEPKPGLFPDAPPPSTASSAQVHRGWGPAAAAMGFGVGGRMTQKIYPDPYGVHTWDQDAVASVTIHVVNTEQYRAMTGLAPPPTPINAREYTEHGLPWFELYDERLDDVAPDASLRVVKSIPELARLDGADPSSEDLSLNIEPGQITRIKRKP
jgi:hypothetical protein